LEGEQMKLEELQRLMAPVLARWICCSAGLNDRIAIEAVLLIRPQEVSTCRVFNLGITEEAFYAAG